MADRLRVAGLLLAALALVMRLAIPAGFMLDVRQDQRIEITLCSGQGAVQSILDLTTGQILDKGAVLADAIGHEGKSAKSSLCGFAALSVAPPAPFFAFFAILFAQAAPIVAAPREIWPQLTPTGPPPGRGPPSSI